MRLVIDDLKIRYAELFFKDLNQTVISIQGTDFGRILDIFENLRLWTEPVVLSLMGLIFPSIRFWPQGTTAMMLRGFSSVHHFCLHLISGLI